MDSPSKHTMAAPRTNSIYHAQVPDNHVEIQAPEPTSQVPRIFSSFNNWDGILHYKNVDWILSDVYVTVVVMGTRAKMATSLCRHSNNTHPKFCCTLVY
jgi:hypothetical protein